MTQVGALNVRIGADATDFSAGVRQAAERLNQLEGSFEKAGRNITAAGDKIAKLGKKVSVGVSAPITAAATAITAFAVKFASSADDIAKKADKLGISTDAFQELGFAAERSGVSSSSLETSLGGFLKRVGEARTGIGSLSGLIDDYGLAIYDANGEMRDQKDILGDVANLVANAGSEAEGAAIATAAFGRAGVEMLPLLKQGQGGIEALAEEARKLGGVIGEETLRDSEKFQDNLTDLKTQLTGAGTAIGAALIPAFNDLMPVLQEKVIPGIQAVAEAIANGIEWFAALPGPVQEAAGIIAGVLGVGGPVLMAVGMMTKAFGALLIATGPIGLFIAAAAAIYMAWQVWGDDITELVGTVSNWLVEKFTWLKDTILEVFSSMGDMITGAFRAPLDAVTNMTTSAVESINEKWEWLKDVLVGNSVIPDIMDLMENEFYRLDDMVAQNDRAASMISGIWEKNAKDQTKAIQDGTRQGLGLLEGFFEDSKAIGIAQAIANTWIGVSETLARYPWPIAGVLASIHAAAGLQNVASIRSTNKNSKGGGGGGFSGGSAASAAPERQTTQVMRLEGINPGSLYSGEHLISAINDAQRQGYQLEVA